MRDRVIKTLIITTIGTFLLSGVPVFASTQLISAGAGKALDADTRTVAGASADHSVATEVAKAGADGVEKSQEAAQTIALIMNEGTTSEDTATADTEHQKALSIVTGEVASDGTICGYTNLGIAKVDNWLNVRKEPSENGEIIGKMPKNAGCEILSQEGEWAHIKSGKVEGYANLEYMYTGQEAIDKAPECIKLMATVTTTTLFVREQPTTESAVITMVPMEEELEVMEELEGWVKISIDDEEGYISKDYVSLAEQMDHAVTIQELRYGMGVSELRIKMVNYAKQFLGNRYVWGGTSLTKGTDCSGFTMGIYRNFGVSLPRVSRSQATVGTKISVADLKPGDLVFYGKGSYINHVAMYIGGGQVIHASSPKTGIKISNVSYRTPITCRRVIND